MDLHSAGTGLQIRQRIYVQVFMDTGKGACSEEGCANKIL